MLLFCCKGCGACNQVDIRLLQLVHLLISASSKFFYFDPVDLNRIHVEACLSLSISMVGVQEWTVFCNKSLNLHITNKYYCWKDCFHGVQTPPWTAWPLKMNVIIAACDDKFLFLLHGIDNWLFGLQNYLIALFMWDGLPVRCNFCSFSMSLRSLIQKQPCSLKIDKRYLKLRQSAALSRQRSYKRNLHLR